MSTRPRRRQTLRVWRAVAFLVGAIPSAAVAADPDPAPAGTYDLHPALEMSLFAAEPMVVDPVALTFDEFGRAYVAEMRDYPYGIGPDGAAGGTVRLLEDTNGDGRADRSTVFAEKLRYPTSVLAWNGGILVTVAPEILFLKDADGDGRAEVREVVLAGFHLGVTDSNLNGLRWGLDNQVHAANGGNGGRLTSPKRPSAPAVVLGDRDLRFRPDTGEFDLTSHTGGGFGLIFDEWGRSFTTYNINHIQQRVADPDDFARVRGLAPFETTHSISDHGDMARIYPVSVARTRPNHPEQAGHFSAAGGVGYLGHRGWPAELFGSVLVCDVVGNLVHRDRLVPEGPIFRATRADDETTREFFASRDGNFRPVGIEAGPDGAMYLIDMQRDVIEHPDYIPKKLRETIDIRAGEDRGRIYRWMPRDRTRLEASVRRAGTEDPATPGRERLPGRATSEECVALLASPNPWTRQTAQRVLVARGDRSVVPALEKAARGRGFRDARTADVGRVHALWVLDAWGALEESVLRAAFESDVAGVRENAVALAAPKCGASPRLRGLLERALKDPDAAVRFRAALALAGVPDAQVDRETAVSLWERDAAHLWSRRAALTMAGADAPAILGRLMTSSRFRASAPTTQAEALRELAAVSVAGGVDLEAILRSSQKEHVPDGWRIAVLDGLTDGMSRVGRPESITPGTRAAVEAFEASETLALRTSAWRLSGALGLPPSPAFNRAMTAAARDVRDSMLPLERRLEAVRVLGLGPLSGTATALFGLLAGTEPAALQEAAFSVLREHKEPEIAVGLVSAWPALAPTLRPSAVNLLVYRQDFHDALLRGIEEGRLQVGELNLDLEHRRQLLRKAAPGIRERAAKFMSDEEYSNRSAVVERWLPLLPATGDGARGRLVFERLCSPCHVAEGVGHAVGPELTRQNHRSVEDLLSNILDPNMAMNPAFVAFTAELADGEQETGILSAETPGSVTLLQALGRKVELPRARVKQLRSNGRSLMPEGLENGLTPAELRDLIAFLQGPTASRDGGAH